jgi:hypothetical protein
MKRIIGALFAMALLFAAAPMASANTITITDPLTPTDDLEFGHKFNVHTDFFSDLYKFTVAQSSTLVLDFTLTGNLNFGVTLVGGGNTIQLGSLNSMVSTTGELTVAGLVAGTQYFLSIIGEACSCSKYQFDMSVAATPIPPAIIMFLTGLAGLGGFAWYRRSAANP